VRSLQGNFGVRLCILVTSILQTSLLFLLPGFYFFLYLSFYNCVRHECIAAKYHQAFAFKSSPFTINTLTTSSLPSLAATCKGVQP
jgi:hypothetical protein